jgi:hypothetical protein
MTYAPRPNPLMSSPLREYGMHGSAVTGVSGAWWVETKVCYRQWGSVPLVASTRSAPQS